jgi:hypothetical protein
MKVVSKVKKIFLVFATFFVGVYTKVLGIGRETEALYGLPPASLQPDYGVFYTPTTPKSIFWPIFLIILIPVILIIGIVVFIKHRAKKKDKEQKNKK